MPAIGEGLRSSSLDPAGSSLSNATRGSAAAAGAAAAGGSTAAARTLEEAAAQNSRIKTAADRSMQRAPRTFLYDPLRAKEVQPNSTRPLGLRSAARMML